MQYIVSNIELINCQIKSLKILNEYHFDWLELTLLKLKKVPSNVEPIAVN